MVSTGWPRASARLVQHAAALWSDEPGGDGDELAAQRGAAGDGVPGAGEGSGGAQQVVVMAAQVAQAALAATGPRVGASGPSMRSARTVSMIACRRWVMSAAAVDSVLLVKSGGGARRRHGLFHCWRLLAGSVGTALGDERRRRQSLRRAHRHCDRAFMTAKVVEQLFKDQGLSLGLSSPPYVQVRAGLAAGVSPTAAGPPIAAERTTGDLKSGRSAVRSCPWPPAVDLDSGPSVSLRRGPRRPPSHFVSVATWRPYPSTRHVRMRRSTTRPVALADG